MAGGERQVVALLEDESREQISQSLLRGEEKPVTQKRTLHNFIFNPYVVGKNLLTIEKFGLVQYVCQRGRKFHTYVAVFVIFILILLYSADDFEDGLCIPISHFGDFGGIW